MASCTHNKYHPNLYVAVTRKCGEKVILRKLCKKITHFYARPNTLRCLTSRALPPKNPMHAMKSQRREAVVRVLCGLIQHVELATLRVGIPTARGFEPLGLKFFIKLVGLSRSRYMRALADINASGILTTHRRYKQKKSTGEFRGLNAVRVISEQLFISFGMGKYLELQRAKAATALYALAERLSIQKIANLTMISAGQREKSRKTQRRRVNTEKKQPHAPPAHPGRIKTKNPHLQAIKDILTR